MAENKFWKHVPAQHKSLHLYIGKKKINIEWISCPPSQRVGHAISTMHGVLDYLLKGSDTTYHTQIYEEWEGLSASQHHDHYTCNFSSMFLESNVASNL